MKKEKKIKSLEKRVAELESQKLLMQAKIVALEQSNTYYLERPSWVGPVTCETPVEQHQRTIMY